MNIKRILCLLTMGGALCLGGESKAQTSDNRSPYSRYGYGSLEGANTAGSRALGGLSVALRDGLITNPGNPASYTAVDSLTFIFDLGVSGRYAFLKEGGLSDKRLLGNLDYITIIFPVAKRLAVSAGIMPLSSTGYTFGNSAQMGGDSNSDTFIRSYSGQGSYNQLYLGVGAKAIADLHIGANASFVFGHTKHERQVTYTTVGALNRVNTSNLHLRGLRLDFGAQYVFKLDTANARSIVLGATFSPAYSYKSELTSTAYEVASGTGTTTALGEPLVTTDGRYTTPNQYGLGLSYRLANSFMYGVDVRYSEWHKAEFTGLEAQFQDQWRVALGGEWTPNHRARSPWKRAKYRLGISAGNSYLKVPTSGGGSYAAYNEYGASLGFALPLVDRRSALNLSLDYKLLSPKVGGMITEQYVGATIGIVFNESWFRKARVN